VPPDAAWSTAARLLDRAGPAEQGGAAADGRSTDPDPWAGGWRLNARPRIRIAAEDGTERTVEVPIDPLGVQPAAVVGPDGSVHVDIGGRSVAFRVAPAPDVERAARAAGHHGPTSGEVVSPMPGSVLAVHVAVGATVEAGDPIVTLEAMKMEHVVVAPVAGTIVELAVRVADQVRRGQILAQTG
jgi:biotin carboxyl carrier protein